MTKYYPLKYLNYWL